MSYRKNPAGIRFQNGSPHLFELNSRLKMHFAQKSIYATASFWMKAGVWLAGALLLWWVWVHETRGIWLCFLWSIGAGLCSLFFLLNVGHDAAHGTIVRSPTTNKLLHWFSFGLLGVSSYLWEIRHNHSHHMFPNVNGCDADIDENFFFRFSPHQPKRPRQHYQFIYAPLVYAIVHVHLVVYQDFSYLFKSELANLIEIRHRRRDILGVFLTKIFFLTVWIFLPLHLLPYSWWQIVLVVSGMSAIVSQFFVLPLIGTHFNDRVTFPKMDAKNRLPFNFFDHQVATSMDWSVRSRLARWCYGGLNFHLLHHLYPNVCHTHGSEANEILYDYLKENGIRHHSTSLWDAIASHFRFLHEMATSP